MYTQLLYYIFLVCAHCGCSDTEILPSEYTDLHSEESVQPVDTGTDSNPGTSESESETTQTTTESSDNPLFQNTELIFQSGFESETRITDQNSQDARILGTDNTLQNLNDWESDLDSHEKIGYSNIQYQGGNSNQRLAEIVTDPVDPSNKVLKFWIKDPNLNNQAGRIQANIYENTNIKEMDYSVRLFIPEDFESVKSAPFRVKWLTLMEFWNNANWSGESHQYRITVNLQKWSKETDDLVIGIKSQARKNDLSGWADPPVWEYINDSFQVPIGKWMRIDIYFREGNENNGRFELRITPEGETSTIVHDIRNVTHHPGDPNPDGLSHFNPLKLYTSASVINTVNQDGNLLQVYWDDFKLAIDDVQ